MKYIKTFFIWFLLSLLFGAVLYYNSTGQNRYVILVIFIFLGIILGFVHVLSLRLSASRKSSIFDEALKMYHGKKNLDGKPEFTIKGRKVILDYDTEYSYFRLFEYIITNVDLSDLDKELIEICKKEFDTIVVNNKVYAIFYSQWGYQGNKYRERIEKKIDEINKCTENHTLNTNRQIK